MNSLENRPGNWRFGVFEVDAQNLELRRNGMPLKMREQSFRILVFLLEHAGELVSREDLCRVLWPSDTYVDFDHSLNTAMMKVRDVLGDVADAPIYIETVPKRGYRFIAPVVQTADSFKLAPAGVRPLKPDSEVAPHSAASSVRPEAHAPHRWTLPTIAVSVVAVALLVASGLYYRSHQRAPLAGNQGHSLTDKDGVVLADFENTTGDPVFDGTLKQGLSLQLGQSPFFNIVSESKVDETLKLMGRKSGERLTPEIAREICERTGGAMTIAGSVARLGSQYIVGMRAISCASGEVLAQEQEEAASKEQVLKALESASVRMRGKLGESLSSVQKYATPVEATTSSLEALQAFSLAYEDIVVKDDNPGAQLQGQRAVRLDPSFATAYGLLAVVYNNRGEMTLARDNIHKAYELRKRVSERERLEIEAYYDQIATGDLEKARQSYELWAQTYPNNFIPPTNLCIIGAALGQYDKALHEAHEALRLEPASGNNYENLAFAYFFSGGLRMPKPRLQTRTRRSSIAQIFTS